MLDTTEHVLGSSETTRVNRAHKIISFVRTRSTRVYLKRS